MVLKKNMDKNKHPPNFPGLSYVIQKNNNNTHSSSSSSFLLFVKYSLTHKGKNG